MSWRLQTSSFARTCQEALEQHNARLITGNKSPRAHIGGLHKTKIHNDRRNSRLPEWTGVFGISKKVMAPTN